MTTVGTVISTAVAISARSRHVGLATRAVAFCVPDRIFARVDARAVSGQTDHLMSSKIFMRGLGEIPRALTRATVFTATAPAGPQISSPAVIAAVISPSYAAFRQAFR